MISLQHVSIPRPPGPASRQQAQAFYGDLLGLPEKPVPASIVHLDLVWFAAGDAELELHVFAAEPQEDLTGRHFCLVVDDLDGVRRRLSAAGFAPQDTEPIPGRPRFFCRDPFGNRVEFTTIREDYRKYNQEES